MMICGRKICFLFSRSVKKKLEPRVRYAPSPTGPMHLGGIRTAMYNYMFAKKYKGTFILRIEDTDETRNVQGAMKGIPQTLRQFGLNWDEGYQSSNNPTEQSYVQSERLPLYHEYQKKLLKNNLAYPCFCAYQNVKKVNAKKPSEKHSNELRQVDSEEAKRAAHKTKQQTNQLMQDYRKCQCSSLSLEEVKSKIKGGSQYCIKLKSNLFSVPEYFQDEVYGQVKVVPFQDFVIMKKNGSPTYHFANVIDDWKMKITHVIRGQEWLTNTPKHLYLYKVLEAPIPKFVHLPLIQDGEGRKLSKRHWQDSFEFIERRIFQKQVMINYIARLGWKQSLQPELSAKDNPKETPIIIYSLPELCEKFELEKISKAPVRMDLKQLEAMNKKYIRDQYKQSATNGFQHYLIKELRSRKIVPENAQDSKLQQFLDMTIHRVKSKADFKQYAFLFQETRYADNPRSLKDFHTIFGKKANLRIEDRKLCLRIQNSELCMIKRARQLLQAIGVFLSNLKQSGQQEMLKSISIFLVQNQSRVKNTQLYFIFRFILTGYGEGIPVHQLCHFIGANQCINKLKLWTQICLHSEIIDNSINAQATINHLP